MFLRLPHQSIKDLRPRAARADASWPAPERDRVRLRRSSRGFSRFAQPFAALIGAAMVGGAATAGMIHAVLPDGVADIAAKASAFTAPRVTGPVSPESLAVAAPALPADATDMPVVWLDDPVFAPGPVLSAAPVAAPGVSPAEALLNRYIPEGSLYGDQPRIYLFAGGGGQSVGLNYVRDGRGGWRRDDWSRDSLALIGDGQVGVGIRKGPVQVSVGYVYRQAPAVTEFQTLPLPDHEEMAAVTLSIKPVGPVRQ